jgi:polyisoprenoid-binding protein YceI
MRCLTRAVPRGAPRTGRLHEMRLNAFRVGAVVLLTLLLAACAAERKPIPVAPEAAPAGFPERAYREVPAAEPVYRIDPGTSRILIYVYREGSLARIGHDHVVASHEVRGYALIPDGLDGARADFYFRVATLTVDETELRNKAGFTTEPSAEDIENTRQRMLRAAVLDAEKYPFVQIHAVPASTKPSDLRLSAEVTLHGVTRTLQIPVKLAVEGARFSVQGETDIRQSEFGITPFSVLGGALAVKDELHVIFDVQGVRVNSGR